MNQMRVVAVLLVVLLIMGCSPKSAPQPAPQTPKATGNQQAEQSQVQVWTCPMHSQIREPKPGKCKICGMDLVQVKKDEGQQGPGK